jgi:hypothetical protein
MLYGAREVVPSRRVESAVHELRPYVLVAVSKRCRFIRRRRLRNFVSGDELLRCSHCVVPQVKNRFAEFKREMMLETQRQIRIEADLRKAMECGEFEVH